MQISAASMLLSILGGRRRANALYAGPLQVYGNPTIQPMLQQFLPITPRQALILSSGRNDIQAAEMVVQLDQQNVAPAVVSVDSNAVTYFQDTFQGVGALQSHVGESGFEWAENQLGYDFNAVAGGPVLIDATGLIATFKGEYFSSGTWAPNTTEINITLRWTDSIVNAQFNITATATPNSTSIFLITGMGAGALHLLIGGVDHFIPIPAWFVPGPHELTAAIGTNSQIVTLDGNVIFNESDSLAVTYGENGVRNGVGVTFDATDPNTTVQEITVTGNGALGIVVPEIDILRGIPIPQLKPQLIVDFKVAPVNPVSVAARLYETPASDLDTVLNITQGF